MHGPDHEQKQREQVRDWGMLVDLGQHLIVPSQITTLRPDLMLWSNTLPVVYLVELIVQWEAADEANQRKRLR